MPCICYGAVSGNEEYDRFLKSEEGKMCSLALQLISNEIKQFELHEECMPMEFRQMFVKAFLHMLIGCDEKGLPKLC